MSDHMIKPCAHCPFRRDITPFLHPERATDIAYSAQSPYSDFSCHKTVEYGDDDGEGDITEESKTCAGWLAMAINEGGQDAPDGWVWPENIYTDSYEMINAYEEAWDASRRRA